MTMSKKRTLEAFFHPPPPKKPKLPTTTTTTGKQPIVTSNHPSYPFPIPHLPASLSDGLCFSPATEGRLINNQPDLDLLYFEPYIAREIQRELFLFLRQELPFYRVRYVIRREGGVEREVKTPRFTSVFGVDDTAYFGGVDSGVEGKEDEKEKEDEREKEKEDEKEKEKEDDPQILHDSQTHKPIPPNTRYKHTPRPIPHCLNQLRLLTERATDQKFNFCLVNYYATGSDSIAYHSDDERFLGKDPAIASLSLGARRDFLMKHKPLSPATASVVESALQDNDNNDNNDNNAKPLKLALASGDMVLMRGPTQANWLHSIPKRKGGESDRGRINITFRRAMVRGGTENYYQYNVGVGPVYRWDGRGQEMRVWEEDRKSSTD